MAKHAHPGGAGATLGSRGPLQHGVRAIRSALDWHDSRPRASADSLRGWVWIALITVVYFWMSNPLVFIPGFHLALPLATTWTTVVVLLTLPWVRLPRIPWPWIAFLALGAVSMLWTIDPHLTDYTSHLYVKITLVALAVAANCEPQVASWGMGIGGVVVTAASLYAYREEMWGAWDLLAAADGGTEKVLLGVGTNDNILAYTLALALAALLAQGLPRRTPARAVWIAVLATNAYGLYAAGSGTGFVTTICIVLAWAAVVAWPALQARGPRAVLAVAAGSMAALFAGFVLVGLALGKDLGTLSDRSPFWRATITDTLERAPFLGSGWGAVWQHPWSLVPPNAVGDAIIARAGYPLSHGHNFFIDVFPELGLAGVAMALIMVAYVVREVKRHGLHAGGKDPAMGRLALLVLVALLTSGITEPTLTVPLGWWSLALIAAMARQRMLAPRPRARQGFSVRALSGDRVRLGAPARGKEPDGRG